MRILDLDSDKSVSNLLLMLEREEAKQLYDYIEALLNEPLTAHHHVSSKEYDKEITVCLYDPEQYEGLYTERVTRLITSDK